MINEFNITEYRTKFTERAEELANTKVEKAPPVEIRVKEVDNMIEEYYRLVGLMPPSRDLEKLANYILIKELKDRDVDKVSRQEYPILSDVQMKRRNRKQVLMEDSTIDFLNTKYHKQIAGLSRASKAKPEY